VRAVRRVFAILLSLIAIVGIAAGIWHLLQQRPPAATWLRVTAPRQADAGTDYPIQVVVESAEIPTASSPLQLCVDLHGYTRRHEWRNCISSGTPQPLARDGAVQEFKLAVPHRPDLRYVAIVAYLSPTGQWNDHQTVASSLEIWYRPEPTGATLTAMPLIAMYPHVPGAPIERHDVLTASIVIALGWIFCTATAWRVNRLQAMPTARRHRLLPIAATLAALWEFLPLERLLGYLARSIVVGLHLYNMRMGFQRIATTIVATVAIAIVIRALLRAENPGLRLQIVGLTVYAGVTAAGFLSLHLVDAVFAREFASMPVMQWVQLVGMLLAASGAALNLRAARVP
jgi:hypothetical protein